jgi:predicted alpha/beta hydrolase
VLGLALYLMGLGKWGKSLKAKNAPLGRRRLYGVLAAFPSLAAPFYYGYGAYNSGVFIFMLVWSTVVAILGFITVVYAPKWIVGTPKHVGHPAAK